MGLGTVDLVDEFLERKFRAKKGMELGLDNWGDFGLFLKVVEETARKGTVLLREVREELRKVRGAPCAVKKRVALNLTLWGVIVEAVGLDPCGVTVKVFAEVLCVALVLSAC
jgi:hypothetical protein